MRVLFWGTSDFALPTLEGLAASTHQIVGVVTRPDRPAGRGRRPRPTPVAERAAELGLDLLRPERPRGEAFLVRLEELEPEISVVAAYGEILTEPVLALPRRGSLNVHASLLPELRGAAPVNWAIIRGHRRTGVTIMRMVRALDAGPILRQEEVEIAPDETAGRLFERLAPLGARALLATLEAMERGNASEEREQDHEAASYAPKLDRTTARLEWERTAVELDRWVRGCDPWPGAWSERVTGEGDRLAVQLFRPEPLPDGPDPEAPGPPPGTVVRADDREGLVVAAGRGRLRVCEVKPAGSRRMGAPAWVRGRGVSEGDRFE